jgi:HK97 family phage major capsid protein
MFDQSSIKNAMEQARSWMPVAQPQPGTYQEMLRGRKEAMDQMESIVSTAEKEKRNLTADEEQNFNVAMTAVKTLTPHIDRHRAFSTLAPQIEEHQRHERDPNWRNPNGPRSVREAAAIQAMEHLHDWMRSGVMAADSPLFSGGGPETGGPGLGAAIPLDVLSALRTYYQLNSFELAGATVIGTSNTIPLVKPIISAGPAASTFGEGASSTDSNPFVPDAFTFGADKYSRLVKVSNESLMNVAYDLGSEVTAELMAGLANSQTAAYSTALVTALEGNASCYVGSGADKLSTLLAMLAAIPIRFALPDNKFMLSRANFKLIKDQRDGFGRPLIATTDDTILGYGAVLNDNLTRAIVFGSWANGAYVRKTGLWIQRLIEAYASAGEIGIRATQWSQAKFLASVGSVTTDPLVYATLDGEGS